MPEPSVGEFSTFTVTEVVWLGIPLTNCTTVSTTFGALGRLELEQLYLPSAPAVMVQSGSDWVLLETWMLLPGSAVPVTVTLPPSRSPGDGVDTVGAATGIELGDAWPVEAPNDGVAAPGGSLGAGFRAATRRRRQRRRWRPNLPRGLSIGGRQRAAAPQERRGRGRRDQPCRLAKFLLPNSPAPRVWCSGSELSRSSI